MLWAVCLWSEGLCALLHLPLPVCSGWEVGEPLGLFTLGGLAAWGLSSFWPVLALHYCHYLVVYLWHRLHLLWTLVWEALVIGCEVAVLMALVLFGHAFAWLAGVLHWLGVRGISGYPCCSGVLCTFTAWRMRLGHSGLLAILFWLTCPLSWLPPIWPVGSVSAL